MQPLDLNLSSNPFRNNSLLWLGFTLGFVLLAAMTYWNWSGYDRVQGEYARLSENEFNVDEQMRELDRRRDKALKRRDGFDIPALSQRAGMANEVIEWKAFSWTQLFNDLEKVHPWNVHMTQIQPVFRGEGNSAAQLSSETNKSIPIFIEGVAKKRAALYEFERNLIADPHFMQVEPQREGLTEQGEVQFELAFIYYPEGGAETAGDEQAEADADPAEDDEKEERS